jgi:hypothetical protein
MTLREIILHSAGNRDLVREFDRLTGSNLALVGSPLDISIDEASGRLSADVRAFVAFVATYVALPEMMTPSDQ